MSDGPQYKNPIREMIQPFIDLVHAPRALWGVNLAYVIEGMVYFGMLGYLAMHFSDFIFQGIDHADEYSHTMVMVLTAGITIAMFFLGFVADKRGVRFALIAAFVVMLFGRGLIAGAPNVLGFEPTRPGVVVGDEVSLHVTKIETKDANKAITKAEVIANNQRGDGAAPDLALDLAAGAGIAPNAELESRLVKLSEAVVVAGEGDSWKVRYGSTPIRARLIARSAENLCIAPGAVISLESAYVTARERDNTDESVNGENQAGKEYIIHCHWAEDFGDIDRSQCVSEGDARILQGIDRLESDDPAEQRERVLELLKSNGREELSARALDLLASSGSEELTGRVLDLLQAHPQQETDGGGAEPCEVRESTLEKIQRATERWPVEGDKKFAKDATAISISELRKMKDGPVNCVLRDVYVSYVRNGGYFVQSERNGPALFVFVNPLWSGLHWLTMLGILFVVVGYGMYQPGAYAAVRQFTTPKTAAMGFAMLYALMNLGGWLPTFAFLLRDEDFLNLGIPGTYWFYTCCTAVALIVTVFILSKKTVAKAIARAKEERAAIEAAEGKKEEEKKPVEAELSASEPDARRAVPPHMWVFAAAVVLAIYLKVPVPVNYYVCGALVVAWIVLALIPVTANWLAKHPLSDLKFFFFIFALIPVQTLFTYNWLILPQYINRAYEGWIGEYFEIAANANPLLIFVAVPLITAATQKARVYNMMIYGTFVMAAPAFLLVIGPHWWTLASYLLIMTIGEAMWQPRFLQYAAEIAPEGRTGQYMGVAQLPWFATKMLVPWLYSGWMMDRYCPAEGEQNTQFMWLVFACIAMCSTVLLLLAKGWIGKDFKTKAA